MSRLPNFKEYYQDKSEEEYLEVLSSVKTLYESMRQFEKNSDKKTFLLKDAIEYLDLLSQSRQTLNNMYKYGQGGVNLMSAHAAKGLEFDYVFILGASEEIWKNKGKKQMLKPPSNLAIGVESDNDEDYLRLFFVAITRAKKEVIIIVPRTNGNRKKYQQLSFINGVEYDEVEAIAKKPESTIENLTKYDSFHVDIENKLKIKPKLKINKKKLLEGRLQNYLLSITHLNNFVNVFGYDDQNRGGPEYFRDTNLLNFPSYKPANARYGTAIHETLSTFIQNELQDYNDKPSQIKRIKEIFKKRLTKQRLDKDEHEIYLNKGYISLENYWNRSQYDKNKYDYKFEFSFSKQEVFLGEAHLTGNIDLIQTDKETGEITVIDFKTGEPIDSLNKKADGSKRVKQLSYIRQLEFYYLLMINSKTFSNSKSKLKSARLEFIDARPDQLHVLDMEYKNLNIEKLQKLIQAVWKKIMNLDFQNTNLLYENKITSIEEFIDDLIEENQSL